uniref:Uncharacterized protein n=1 Tax=Arundo donax TaxID=35708 RepID=A0A0A9CJX3_ARUDO
MCCFFLPCKNPTMLLLILPCRFRVYNNWTLQLFHASAPMCYLQSQQF